MNKICESTTVLFALLITCLIAFPAAVSSQASSIVSMTLAFGRDLGSNSWQLMTFPRRTPAKFAAKGMATLSVDADRAVAVLWRQMKPAIKDAETSSWRWRVETSVAPTDLSVKGGDDRAIAIYFVFSNEIESSRTIDLGAMMRSRRGDILTYVWGGSAARGAVLPSPYFGGNGRTIVLRSGSDPIGHWVSERVDLRSDYRKSFGKEPPALVAVAISSDSDDTQGRNLAKISGFSIDRLAGDIR